MIELKAPCPASQKQLQKTGDNCYICNGCNEKVVDFTQSSPEEILAFREEKVCGIFREDQLASKPVLHWKKAILFRLLTAASFLGFSISPIYADEQIPVKTEQAEFSTENKKKLAFKPRKKKRRKKHSNTRTKGVPTWM